MPALWLEACKQPVVPGTKVHAMALTPLFLFVVWWSWTTLALVVVSSAAMAYVQIKGRQPGWIVRNLKSRLRGGRVRARPVWFRRRRSRMESYESINLEAAYALADVPGTVNNAGKTSAGRARSTKPAASR